MATIELRNIQKSFGKTEVLKKMSLTVNDGEFLALLGPSGCGKSTLLRLIAGLDQQDAGEIHISDVCIDGLRPAARDVAMVFQSYALYPHMTVAQNIASPLRVRQLGFAERLPLIGKRLPSTRRKLRDIRREVETVASSLEIDHLLDRKPGRLSGGQRQRVAIGRAVVRRPQVFLMDEPLSNLDYNLRIQMRNELVQLHRRLLATIVYITHDQAEAMAMADRIAVMHSGEILQVGTPGEIYTDPSCRAVAEFVGTLRINMIAGELSTGLVRSGMFTLPVEGAGNAVQPVAIGVRPEMLTVGPPSDNGWRGTVSRIEHLGSEHILHVDLEDGLGAVLVRSDPFAATPVREKSRISLLPRPGHALFFDANGRRLPFHMRDQKSADPRVLMNSPAQ